MSNPIHLHPRNSTTMELNARNFLEFHFYLSFHVCLKAAITCVISLIMRSISNVKYKLDNERVHGKTRYEFWGNIFATFICSQAIKRFESGQRSKLNLKSLVQIEQAIQFQGLLTGQDSQSDYSNPDGPLIDIIRIEEIIQVGLLCI